MGSPARRLSSLGTRSFSEPVVRHAAEEAHHGSEHRQETGDASDRRGEVGTKGLPAEDVCLDLLFTFLYFSYFLCLNPASACLVGSKRVVAGAHAAGPGAVPAPAHGA